jgi:hypothetical protein
MNAKDDLQLRWWKLEEKILKGAKARPHARGCLFPSFSKWLLQSGRA